MEEDQQFCLRWNNHQSTLISVFDTLLENGTLVDCTLAAEGKFLKAHKVVLSACSPYFATLLSEQYDKHPIFILKDVKYQELRAMMDYMYRGEVNISQDQLAALLKAAESLQIKGLSDNRGGSGQKQSGEQQQKHSGHVPGKMTNIGHIGGGGYTLEQSKRARVGPSSIDSQDMCGSREGSSSPTSRKRRKIRRRSVDNVMGDNHENSNSSQSIQINSSAISSGTGAITTSIVSAGTGTTPAATSAAIIANQTQTTLKTDNLSKLDTGVSVSTISTAGGATSSAAGTCDENDDDDNEKSSVTLKKESMKQLQLQRVKESVASLKKDHQPSSATEIVIEPKSEYDDGNDETVEDLTLDDEEMALEELDQTAGPSHGGEGSSQGYAQWQVDRSQDEVFMAAQEAQQRDPQDKLRIEAAGSAHKESTAQTESRIRVKNWSMMADRKILEKEHANQKKLTTKPAINTYTRIKPNTTVTSTATTNTKKSLLQLQTEHDDGLEDDFVDLTDFVVKIEHSQSSTPNSLVMNLELDETHLNGDGLDDDDDAMEDDEVDLDEVGDDAFFDIKISSPISWDLETVKLENTYDEVGQNGIDETLLTNLNENPQRLSINLNELIASASAPKRILNRKANSLNAGIRGGGNTSITVTRSQQQVQQSHNAAIMRAREFQKQQDEIRQQLQQRGIDLKPQTITSAGNGSGGGTDKKYRVLLQNAKARKESLEHTTDMIYNEDFDKPWVCRNCNRQYKWKNSLKCHLKNECGQPPRFFCKKMCGYATNVHSNLKRHLNTKCRDRDDENLERYEIVAENEKTE